MRTLTIYRDDTTAQVRIENVKHWFWTAGNTVLTVAVVDDEEGNHHYVHWPRERVCWFRDDPMKEQGGILSHDGEESEF